MTTEAIITMSIVWTIIIFFAGYFLTKVIRTPQDKSKQRHNVEDPSEQDSSEGA